MSPYGVPYCLILGLLVLAKQSACLERNTCASDKTCDLNLVQVQEETSIIEHKVAAIFNEGSVNYTTKWASSEENTKAQTGAKKDIHKLVPGSNLTTARFEGAINDENEKQYMLKLAEKFIAFAKPFDASRSPKSSDLCRMHTNQFLNAIKSFELWALKMHDSSGKLTSGILNGNINQMGDFDQCLAVHSPIGDIHGQYCLAYIQPRISYKSDRLQNIMKLIQSHSAFKSEFHDPGHRVPRFNLINWGICIPSSCTPQSVEYVVNEYLENSSLGTGLSFDVRVEPSSCQTSNKKKWDQSSKLVAYFFGAIFLLTALSTVYEKITNKEIQNGWFTAFSLDKNGRWLFSTVSSSDDIKTVHGIRFLNALMLLFAHKSMAVFFNAYNNRTYMAESLGQPWTVIGRAASLYTDPFLLFSGMLTSYSLCGRLMKEQPINLKNEYIGRFIRIVPPLVALILFCTFILPKLGSGPQWNLVVEHHSELCKRNWWRNLLFIHNYFGFSEMCLTHTHHLGIDTELFVIAPILIFGLWKWPRQGLWALIFLAALGTAGRYYTTVMNELSNYVYFGTTIQRLFRTADYMYSFPPYRSTVYIMGIILGYVLRKSKGMTLTTFQLKLGWIIAVGCYLISTFGPAPMGDITYSYNSTHAGVYAALAPIAWCLFFSWIVFVSHLGYENKFTDFLSWNGFQISTKLSYSIYLTQFPVFFFNVGRRRHIQHYYNFISLMLDTNEFICIIIASITLTIIFDAPFQNIKRLIFKPNSKVIIPPKCEILSDSSKIALKDKPN